MRTASLVAAASLSLLACAQPPPAPDTATSGHTRTALEGLVGGPAARELVKGGAKLIDVRSPEEFNAGHVAGAQNVPGPEMEAHDFGAKDQPIVVYCYAGGRATLAAATLLSKGYTRVYNLGSMANWDDK